MGQTVVVVGIEHRDAREVALGFLSRGFQVYGIVTSGDAGQVEVFSGRYPNLKTVFVNCVDDMKKIAAWMEERETSLDILVLRSGFLLTSDGNVKKEHNYADISRIFEYNVQGTREIIEGMLPLLRKGKKKRIALVTSKNSSIGETQDKENFAYHMSISAINMMMRIYFNQLRPEGFSFRCYAVEGTGGLSGTEYINLDFCYDEKEPYIHSEENRFVMRDSHLREIAW